jgi:hypothetical protein
MNRRKMGVAIIVCALTKAVFSTQCLRRLRSFLRKRYTQICKIRGVKHLRRIREETIDHKGFFLERESLHLCSMVLTEFL